MPVAQKFIQYLIVFLQAGFAGILLGQSVSLFLFQQPQTSFIPLTVGLMLFSGLLLYRFRKNLQLYVYRSFNFNWLFFTSGILQFIVLLLLFLPVFFAFEESPWIILSIQLGVLFGLFLLLVEAFVIQFGPQQKLINILLPNKKSHPLIKSGIGLASLLLFGSWNFFFYSLTENGILVLLQYSYYFGLALVLPLLGLKVLFFKMLRSFNGSKDSLESSRPSAATDHAFMLQENYFYLERNLKETLLRIRPEDRPLVYGKIRQVPLIDKIEELEFVQEKYLPDDEDLFFSLQFLRNIRQNLQDQGPSFDIDTAGSLLEIKACIRIVIAEGNSLLIQKLLNDSRPEVKKAAIFASVHFQEPSLIPSLVDLLKDPEYAFSAKEVLYEFGDQCLSFLRSAKYRNKNNSFFIEQCLELVKSYHSDEAGDFLVEMLNEPQKRFQYKAAVALLDNNYPLSGLQKTQVLQFIESLIGTIAILREIYCRLAISRETLRTALLEEEAEKKELLIGLLKAFLPDAAMGHAKRLLRQEEEKERVALYAFIDLYFPLILRTKCKLLFASRPDENFAPALQAEYLQEQIHFNYASEQEAIRQILKMDFGQIGYWLRACALKELTYSSGQQPSVHLLAEVFNTNPLLQETACEVLYDLSFDFYFLYMQRLPAERAKLLKHKIETFKISSEKEHSTDNQLRFQQILFFRSLPLFAACSYESLARNLELFSLLSLGKAKKKLNFDPYKPNGYWIVYQGAFSVYYRGELILEGRKGAIMDMSFLTETEKNLVSIQPIKEVGKEQGLVARGLEHVLPGQEEVLAHEEKEEAEEILIYFIEYSSFNKLYLKTGNLNNYISQPKFNHSTLLHLA